MPTLEGILGFSNIWYQDAVTQPLLYTLPNGVTAKIIHPVYYIATKTEAFRSRGKADFRASHDFEDIVSILNGRVELIQEMRGAKPDVVKAMRDYWLPKLGTANMIASIKEHLDAYEDIERTPLVVERFRQMLT